MNDNRKRKHQSTKEVGFISGFEAKMDDVLESATSMLPGVVVFAKHGKDIYHKAFGYADKDAEITMTTDMPFRMYSMTKVMTSALALMLQERVGEPASEDDVSKFIPSFARNWDVVETSAETSERVEVTSLLTGVATDMQFVRRKSTSPMLIKHLMAECSGIGYEFFSDLDRSKDGQLETKQGYAIANAIRRQLNPTVYTSRCILGHDLTLEQFCEVIASSGVLCTDPGVLSYGLGATVLGRVIEVVYAKHFQAKPLRDIFHELLFKPLHMTSAVFFDSGLAEKMPKLYGLRNNSDGSTTFVPAEESVPTSSIPYTNQRDHFSGPMKYDSGDTGSVMTVADYAKFLQCLLHGGVGPDGVRVLSESVVATLVQGRHRGLSFDTGVGKMMGFSNAGAVFSYGWATQERTDSAPKQNYWSGYAGTHFRLYPESDSFIVQGVQCMDHFSTGFLQKTLRDPCLSTFLEHWATDLE